MKDHMQTGAHRALSRPSYAKRFVACLVGLIGYGAILGLAFQSKMMTDPMNALTLMYGFIILGNVVAGSFFALFTYRRALDCKFGQNGKAWIATLAALPTLALPQYGLLVFLAMMLFRSAPEEDEAPSIVADEGILPSLHTGE